MVRIVEAGEPLTNDQLEDLEQDLLARLPEPYRQFLAMNNGGAPSPDIVEVEGLPGSPTDIQIFFGIGRRVESSDIRWNKRTFASRLPGSLLPIACDSGGNLFCLSLTGRSTGNIVYVDLDQDPPGLYLVANDFEGFLDKVKS